MAPLDQATIAHLTALLEKYCREDQNTLVLPPADEGFESFSVRDEKTPYKGLALFGEEATLYAGFQGRIEQRDGKPRFVLVPDHSEGFVVEVGLDGFPGAIRARARHLHMLGQRAVGSFRHALYSSQRALRDEKLTQMPLAEINVFPGKPLSIRMEAERRIALKKRA